MSLSSFNYILFLALTGLLYFRLPKRFRAVFLLAASYLFYCLWSPLFGILLASATAVSFLCARAFEKQWLGKDKLWIWVGAVYLFGMLFLYKYMDFFVNTFLLAVGQKTVFSSGLLLPVGISFYTFSAASYLFDVKNGKIPAEKNLVHYALFVAFFPSILSGPINRAGKLLPQIRESRDFSYTGMKSGLNRFAAGAIKKLVVADSLGMLVNGVYGDLSGCSGGMMALAAAAYSLQIYFDFDGYTDMATGSAHILGFDLEENFRAPYLATSVKEFWKRWHLSLTSWFREYLYFPLGGSRVSKRRTYMNVLVVFAVSGLWHGADLSFVIWGLLNGMYQVIGQIAEPVRSRKKCFILHAFRCGFTFVLLTAAWIFFRADTTADAIFVLKNIVLIPVNGLGAMPVRDYIGLRPLALSLLCACGFALNNIRKTRTKTDFFSGLEEKSLSYWLLMAGAAVFIAVFGVYGEGFNAQSFVYFHF